jgi:DNA invertase Pin-like site-specific DNA recombinase
VRVIGYVRVSHEDSARTGYGLADQRSRIEGEAQRRGWSLTWQADEAISGRTLERPGLARALDSLRRKGASALVVAKLDRLSRSVGDFASLVERAQREGWQLVILDLGVDTTTPAGKLVANMFAALAQWEREVIAERTRAGLAAAKAQGVRLGRPRSIPADVVAEIVRLRHEEGWSLQRIADSLNEADIPTGQGGRRWWPSTIDVVLRNGPAEVAVG